jgi:hypothetical protein
MSLKPKAQAVGDALRLQLVEVAPLVAVGPQGAHLPAEGGVLIEEKLNLAIFQAPFTLWRT